MLKCLTKFCFLEICIHILISSGTRLWNLLLWASLTPNPRRYNTNNCSKSIRGSQQQLKENRRRSFCKFYSQVVEQTTDRHQRSKFSKSLKPNYLNVLMFLKNINISWFIHTSLCVHVCRIWSSLWHLFNDILIVKLYSEVEENKIQSVWSLDPLVLA